MAGINQSGVKGRKLHVLFRALALLAVCTFTAPALANEAAPDPRGIGVIIIDFKVVEMNPRGIGVIIIDFMTTNSVVPLAEDRRVFDSEEHYFDWLRSSFNFRNRDGDAWDVSIVTRGHGYAYDRGLTNLLPVADPLATFIGGRTGEVQIGENVVCVNAERCSNAVDPFTLSASPDVELASATAFDEGARAASLSYARTSLGAGDHGKWEHARVVSTTSQVSGGFEVLDWNRTPEAELVCDNLVSIEDSNCYWVPKSGEAWFEVIGANELTVGVSRLGKVEDKNGHCYQVVDATADESGSDITAISVRMESYGWELDNSPSRFGTRPNVVSSAHIGEDPWGVSGGMEREVVTDVVADCN